METKWGLPYLDLTAWSVGLGTTEARRRTGCWVCSGAVRDLYDLDGPAGGEREKKPPYMAYMVGII
jgi:hypothetical protein